MIFGKEYQSKFGKSTDLKKSHIQRIEYAIWQRRFWENTIRDEDDYQNHFDYLHYNPVKHGYVERVRDWQWSSFHRYVQQGVYSIHWGDLTEARFNGIDFGE